MYSYYVTYFDGSWVNIKMDTKPRKPSELSSIFVKIFIQNGKKVMAFPLGESQIEFNILKEDMVFAQEILLKKFKIKIPDLQEKKIEKKKSAWDKFWGKL